jgi:hypothetical protein
MDKKPRGIQENIDRFGSANMYLSGALDLLCIRPSEILPPIQEMSLRLSDPDGSLCLIEAATFDYKFEKFKQLCKENFWHVAQDNQDPSLDPFLIITHDHLRERSQTELRQGLTAFEAYERRIEIIRVARPMSIMAVDTTPQSMPTQGIIEWEIYRVVVKSRPLPKIFYKPDWRWGHDREYIPVWELTGDR